MPWSKSWHVRVNPQDALHTSMVCRSCRYIPERKNVILDLLEQITKEALPLIFFLPSDLHSLYYSYTIMNPRPKVIKIFQKYLTLESWKNLANFVFFFFLSYPLIFNENFISLDSKNVKYLIGRGSVISYLGILFTSVWIVFIFVSFACYVSCPAKLFTMFCF